ncbi:hypothetical protein ACP179_23245 [Xenorhabdus stockiae]|uniref:DUF7823 domain-containing protein n=1 Tax=Xenorhabdus stockiae TaxID=351614 RepID=UPI003CF60508
MSDVNKLDDVSEFNSMLTIDIILGAYHMEWDEWGYRAEAQADGAVPSFGAIFVIENRTRIDVAKTDLFSWAEFSPSVANVDSITWNVFPYGDKISQQVVFNLVQNSSLLVTVDGNTYNLGNNTIPLESAERKVFPCQYTGDEAKKLGAILKQAGVTKRLYINWK